MWRLIETVPNYDLDLGKRLALLPTLRAARNLARSTCY